MENNTIKPTENVKPIENILELTGINLENTEAQVRQTTIYLHELIRNGTEITLKGVKLISSGEPIEVKTSLRAIQYINTKSVKRVHPFKAVELERLMKQNEGTISLKPAYVFSVNVLVHNESQIGYALTFKKLVALNNKIFEAYLKGETYTSKKELFPFFLGSTEVKTKNGNMVVEFGKLNGNCGITLKNTQGVKVGVSYKHLPNSVYAMCQTINEMVKNEGLQTATSTQEMAQILESFKGTTL